MLEQIARIFVPITNLLLATGLFYFACSNFLSGLAKLTFIIIEEPKQLLIDRADDLLPDVYWQSKYRLLPLAVITNQSSKPITIYDFVLNGEHTFNMHSHPADEYKVTFQTNKTRLKGVTFTTNESVKATTYLLGKEKYMQPILTLMPYESISGTIMFHYNDSLPSDNKLLIKTSRKDFEFEIKVVKELTSAVNSDYIPPQELEW